MMLAAGASAAAMCGVHSPLNPSQEIAFAAELQAALQQRAPGTVQLSKGLVHLLLHVRRLVNQICIQLALPLQRAVVIVPCPTAMLRACNIPSLSRPLPHSFSILPHSFSILPQAAPCTSHFPTSCQAGWAYWSVSQQQCSMPAWHPWQQQ
jgi:hypothetical protein